MYILRIRVCGKKSDPHHRDLKSEISGDFRWLIRISKSENVVPQDETFFSFESFLPIVLNDGEQDLEGGFQGLG